MKKEAADKILKDLREGYAKIADESSSTREKLYGDELKRFVDYVRDGEALLDVGCGDARSYALFAPKNVAYAGVDLSEKLIAAARQRLQGTGAVFEVGDILDLPVPDARYDVVLAVSVLHHVPSEEYRLAAVRELVRAVRPGGYVLMANWNLWQARYWRILIHQRFGKRNGWEYGDFKIAWKQSPFARYYHAFRMTELRRLCEAAGLQVVEQYYVKDGEMAGWRTGENLVTIARRPAESAQEKKSAGA